MVRYEKAVGLHHKDLPSIQDILKKMRDCPKMSRFQWCSCVRSLCDETLLNDFVSTVDSITASEDGSLDMGNSLDPVEEGLQLVAQDRSLPQKRMVIAKKLAAMKSFCTEEVKQPFRANLIKIERNTSGTARTTLPLLAVRLDSPTMLAKSRRREISKTSELERSTRGTTRKRAAPRETSKKALSRKRRRRQKKGSDPLRTRNEASRT